MGDMTIEKRPIPRKEDHSPPKSMPMGRRSRKAAVHSLLVQQANDVVQMQEFANKNRMPNLMS
eukprot:CAMPEP_0198115356 /NCGR_PEP_ID=MMETSP1442-20131203/6487_1 /TAXON_ID= /ORGANISM="Craspedostauros australis, Strain CCMP3328" /LENGTH=62 /DNA_ID=CAMNT_0043772857 /DNA_START=1419 /DNA_END=1607 /DNA_ORIENTATION=+